MLAPDFRTHIKLEGEEAPATDPQRSYAGDLGMRPSAVYHLTKVNASAFIEERKELHQAFRKAHGGRSWPDGWMRDHLDRLVFPPGQKPDFDAITQEEGRQLLLELNGEGGSEKEATGPQLNLISVVFGYTGELPTTCAGAHKLIKELKVERKRAVMGNLPATPKQMKVLKRAGFKRLRGSTITKFAASMFIDKLEEAEDFPVGE